MKARVATVLSLTGVLVAGSAAALVNTQVLRSAARAENTNVGLVGASPDSSSDSSALPTDPSLTTVQVSVATTSPETELTAYQVVDAGVVTLDSAGHVLRIESAKAAAGWTVTSLRQVDGLNVLVTFQQGDNVLEFRANLLYDKITPSVSAYLASQGSGSSSSVATTTDNSSGSNTSTVGTTRTTVDDNDSKSPTTSDDSGKGRGGRGGDDDHPSDDD